MARDQARLTGLFPDERTDALSIGALFARVHGALAGAFPRGRAARWYPELSDLDF